MKTKTWIAFLGIIIFIAGLTACGGGGGKYGDVKPLLSKYTQETEKFVNAMEKAESGKEVASALKDYTKFMKEMKTKMEEIEKKYPELKGMSNPPPELAGEAKRMEEVAMKLGSVMMKAMKFADDPEVKKAQEEWQNVLMK